MLIGVNLDGGRRETFFSLSSFLEAARKGEMRCDVGIYCGGRLWGWDWGV